ncbi:MAG: lytic murein transglycosylase [Pseudomonadota bacterium]
MSAPASADTNYRAGVNKQFSSWLKERRKEAIAHGVSPGIFDRSLKGVKLNWKLPNLKPPGRKLKKKAPNWQAEFRSPGPYFKQSYINSLVATGIKRKAELKPHLDAIQKTYGVPSGIVLGIWAKETSYGKAKLRYNAISTLATLGFMSERPDFFRKELLAALKIVQTKGIAASKMKSAWSGAMGHPQFMPSAYLNYAVDQDGDGKADIWASVPDTLASIANFLKQKGWRGNTWGYEVVLPNGFDCTLEGPDKRRPISDWVNRGVKRTFGRTFSPAQLKQEGSILLPAGTHGPAFIALENFYMLKQYNESDLYALFVGHLADRYGKNRTFAGKWDNIRGLTRGDTLDMQKRLEKLGMDVGGVDGLIGFRSRIAAGEYAKKFGLTPTCYPDKALVNHIRKSTPL